ncbi:MAG: hypothetical protein ACI8W1_000787 [Candidatus Azotimanducaceae bacterium]|jgi:hypothetical protein
MKLCYAILLSIVSSFSISNATQTISTHIYQYDIFVKAEDVGDVTVKVVEQADGSYVLAESTLIDTVGFWGDINTRSTQIETFSAEGHLLKADVKTLNGKKAYWRTAELSDDELWTAYTQVQNVTEKEEGEFVSAALTLGNSMVTGLGNALGVVQLLFSDSEAEPKNLRFATSTYDTSFSNLPFYWESNQLNLPAQINLFDSEKLAVNTYNVEYLGKKSVQNSSVEREVVASHYKLQALDGQQIEVWLAINDYNSPFFLQIVGADGDGPYHIKLKQHPGE